MFSFLSLAIALCLFGAAYHSHAEETSEHFQATITKQVELSYLLRKPKDYDPSEKYPLLIFLHGRGEQGSDLQRVKIHGPWKKMDELELPLLIVAPQSPLDERWDIDALEALTEELIDELNIDEERVYLTGLSMGGGGTWELAARRPDLFAAIVPICGYSVPSKAERFENVAIWVFHGRHDRTVYVKETTRMVDALHKVDVEPRVTIYPDAQHDSWTETYNNPQLYEWLLSQRRGGDGDWPSDRRGGRRSGDGNWPSDRRGGRDQ